MHGTMTRSTAPLSLSSRSTDAFRDCMVRQIVAMHHYGAAPPETGKISATKKMWNRAFSLHGLKI